MKYFVIFLADHTCTYARTVLIKSENSGVQHLGDAVGIITSSQVCSVRGPNLIYAFLNASPTKISSLRAAAGAAPRRTAQVNASHVCLFVFTQTRLTSLGLEDGVKCLSPKQRGLQTDAGARRLR